MSRTFEDVLELAKRADNENRPAEAVELFRIAMAMSDDSSRPLPRLRLAENLRILERFKEARDTLEAVVNMPSKREYLVPLYKGQVCADKGEWESAIRFFKMSLDQNPESTIPYVYLSNALAKMEKNEDAISVLTRALQATGDRDELDRDEVYLNLGLHYRTLGRYLEAKLALAEALKLTPTYEEAKAVLRDVEAASQVLATMNLES